jgi:hypothetical protein
MSVIDRQRIAAVKELEKLGYRFTPTSTMIAVSSTSKSFSRSGPTSRPSAPRYRVRAFASEFAIRTGWILASSLNIIGGRPASLCTSAFRTMFQLSTCCLR